MANERFTPTVTISLAEYTQLKKDQLKKRKLNEVYDILEEVYHCDLESTDTYAKLIDIKRKISRIYETSIWNEE